MKKGKPTLEVDLSDLAGTADIKQEEIDLSDLGIGAPSPEESFTGGPVPGEETSSLEELLATPIEPTTPPMTPAEVEGAVMESVRGGEPVPPGALESISGVEELVRGVAGVGESLEESAGETSEILGRAGAGPYISTLVSAPAGLIGEAIIPKTKLDWAMILSGNAAARRIGEAAKPLGHLGMKLAERHTPTILAAIRAAAKMKIPLTVAELSQTGLARTGESILAKLPGGSTVIEGFREARLKMLAEERDKLLRAFGPSLEKEEIGIMAKEGLTVPLEDTLAKRRTMLENMHRSLLGDPSKRMELDEIGERIKNITATESQFMREKAKALYDALRAQIPDEANSIPAQGMVDTARKLFEAEQFMPRGLSSDAMTILRNIMKGPRGGVLGDDLMAPVATGAAGLVDASGKPVTTAAQALAKRTGWTWEEMSMMRSRLYELQRQYNYAAKQAKALGAIGQGPKQAGQAQYEAKVFGELASSLEKEMDSFAKAMGGTFEKDYALARSFYKEFKNIHDSKAIRKVVSTAPERVYAAIVKPGDVTNIRAVKAAMGQQQFDAVMKRRFMEDLVGREGDELLSPERILKNINNYTLPTLKEMLSASEIKGLMAFAKEGKIPQFIETEIGKRIKRMATLTPTALFDSIMKGDPTIGRVARNIMGPKPWEPFRRKLVERMLGEEGGGLAGASHLANNIDRYLPEFRRLFFTEKEMASIREIQQLRSIMGSAERFFGNAPDTGRAIINLETAMATIRNPVTGLKLAIPPALLAKFYLSETGRRLLRKGLQLRSPLTTERSREAAQIFAQVMSFYGVSKNDVLREERELRERSRNAAIRKPARP